MATMFTFKAGAPLLAPAVLGGVTTLEETVIATEGGLGEAVTPVEGGIGEVEVGVRAGIGEGIGEGAEVGVGEGVGGGAGRGTAEGTGGGSTGTAGGEAGDGGSTTGGEYEGGEGTPNSPTDHGDNGAGSTETAQTKAMGPHRRRERTYKASKRRGIRNPSSKKKGPSGKKIGFHRLATGKISIITNLCVGGNACHGKPTSPSEDCKVALLSFTYQWSSYAGRHLFTLSERQTGRCRNVDDGAIRPSPCLRRGLPVQHRFLIEGDE